MERYEAYKDSGVEWIGEIPEEWNVWRLKHLLKSEMQYGATESGVEYTEALPRYIRITDITQDGLLRDGDKKSLPHAIADPFILEDGDLLFARSGATVGKTFLYRRVMGIAAFAGYLIRACTNRSLIMPEYLNYWTQTAGYDNWKLSIFNQATIQNIGADKYKELPVAYPDLASQKDIVCYLDAKTAEVDALVADCEQEVGLLREYRKAVISEAVTKGLDAHAPMKDSGVEWIGEIPEGWLVAPLKHIVGSIESGTSLDGANWPASENEKGVLTLSSVYQSRFDAKQNKAVSPMLYERLSCPLRSGTLLISRCNTSEWVGTAAYVSDAPENLFLPDKLCQVSFTSDFTCRFIQYALQANAARNYFAALSVGASSTMQNIAKSDLLATPIAIPNDDGVEEIVTYLDAKTVEIDSLIEAKQQMADKLREYRKSLISEAVTGKFKVPGVS